MIDDETLLARVGAAFAAIDPVPEWVRDAALSAYPTHRREATLAELSVDSVDSAGSSAVAAVPAGIRGPGDTRLLVFTGPGVTVEIEVTDSGRDYELAGRLTPAVPAEIAVRHAQGEAAARADRAGHFVVPAVPAGPVSLVFQLPDASSIVTSWVRL